MVDAGSFREYDMFVEHSCSNFGMDHPSKKVYIRSINILPPQGRAPRGGSAIVSRGVLGIIAILFIKIIYIAIIHIIILINKVHLSTYCT